ncbi:MAG: tetratricopeptide repeat protein [Opitutaceae bacterium]
MKKLTCSLSVVAALVLTFGGCSKASRKARYLTRGDRDYGAGRYDAAEIDYLNALRLDPRNAHAIGRLGVIYFDEGRSDRCAPFLAEAEKLEPGNLEVRLKIGLYHLAFKHFAEATSQANYVLDREPNNAEAPLLLAEAATTDDAIAAARKRLDHLPSSLANTAPVLTALGTLKFQERRFDEAAALFKRAVAADPNFAAPYTALGVTDWRKKDLQGAGLAFAKAAELAPLRSAKRLQYAQFERQTGKADQARAFLLDLTRKAPDYLPASVLLASMDESAKQCTDGEALMDKVLQRDPGYPEALLLGGRLKLEAGQASAAVTTLESAAKLYPRYPQVQYELGEAYLAEGKTDQAVNCFNRAVLMAPDYADAALALARLKLRTGDPNSAVLVLRQLAQKHPALTQAQYLLASAYMAQNDPDSALAIYRKLHSAAPSDPRPLYFAGMVFAGQNRPDNARKLFEGACTLAPNFFPPLEQLVKLDITARRYASARRRVEAELAKKSMPAGCQFLLGQIAYAQGDTKGAETALKEAIREEPGAAGPYLLLADVYIGAHRQSEALAELEAVAAKDPKNTQALMLIGVLDENGRNFAAARKAYTQALAANPDFAPALNNLAYIDAEDFSDLDQAFALAQRARSLQPDEPHVADTLGWVLYLRRQYPWALTLLSESAANLPASPSVQFHLGMTQYMLGMDAPARVSFERALHSSQPFEQAATARERLAILAIDPATAGPRETALLEKAAAERPDDPGVLSRLAAVYEREGELAKAISTGEAALKASPKDLATLTRLARLYAASGNLDKALGYARTAHDDAEDNPDVAHLLGKLAFAHGDFAWSYSLLLNASTEKPGDPGLLFDYGQAAYSLGHVGEARTAMAGAANAGAEFPHAAEARRFLELTAFTQAPDLKDAARIEAFAKENPDEVPEVMAAARLAELRGRTADAEAGYAQALDIYPGFTPAKRRFILLYADSGKDNPHANQWAREVRQAYPNDPRVTRACGILAYRSGDFKRAESLLVLGLGGSRTDGEGMFYLGMARYRLKEPSSKATLDQAVGTGLNAALDAQAKEALANLKSRGN